MSQFFTSGGQSIGVSALASVFPSVRVFSSTSVLCITWPKYWSFSFSISPSNEYSGLISFRMDWWDLLAVQRTLKSLLQHRSSKASVLWASALLLHVYLRVYPLHTSPCFSCEAPDSSEAASAHFQHGSCIFHFGLSSCLQVSFKSIVLSFIQ